MTPRTVATRFLCPWEFSRQEHWSGLPHPPPRDLSNPGIKPRSPTLQADILLPELSGKPKNTGVHSLPLLQGFFLTQESNQGLLHCILYQGSPLRTLEGHHAMTLSAIPVLMSAFGREDLQSARAMSKSIRAQNTSSVPGHRGQRMRSAWHQEWRGNTGQETDAWVQAQLCP